MWGVGEEVSVFHEGRAFGVGREEGFELECSREFQGAGVLTVLFRIGCDFKQKCLTLLSGTSFYK